MPWYKRRNKFLVFSLIIGLLFLSACSVEQDPKKAAGFYQKALEAALRGDLEVQIDYLSKAVKYDEKNVTYTVELIENLIKKGNFEKAEKFIEKGLKLNPQSLELRMEVGVAYIQWVQTIDNFLDQGALADKGLKQFNYILEREPDNVDALLYRANTFANYPDMMGMHKQAERDYEHLLKLSESGKDHRFGLCYYYYGEFLASKNRMDEAQAMWEKGLELYPETELIKEKLNQLNGREDG